MFFRLLTHSLARRRSRKLLAMATVWIGLSLVVALVAVNLDVGDKMNREMRSFGANIKIEPIERSIPVRVGGYEIASGQNTAYLEEADLDRLGATFWRNNILGVCAQLWSHAEVVGHDSPILGVWLDHELPAAGGEALTTGARQMYGHWEVRGAWPDPSRHPEQCLVGRELAAALGLRVGDQVDIQTKSRAVTLTVAGVATTGDRVDRALVAPLGVVQTLAGLEGKVSEADVSALTTPENKLAQRYRLDPKSLAPQEYERWVCTPYPGSVAADIQQAIPGAAARIVRRVSETQTVVLRRTKGLMLFLAAITLLASGLSVHGVLTSAVVERRFDMALLRALGAHRGDVVRLFLSEAAAIGIVGGLLAAGTGSILGRLLSNTVFGSQPETHAILLLLGPALGVMIAAWGSYWTVRRELAHDTARVLHGA